MLYKVRFTKEAKKDIATLTPRLKLEPKTLTQVGWVEERNPTYLGGFVGLPYGKPLRVYAKPQPNLQFSLTEPYGCITCKSLP
ncbi:hypothetical protein [Nostoc sp.]|uniref:hypothetical protein n=1 Tax=Nostoc sp. TaxID=1180 RepID=UPI002FFC47EF